MLNFVFIVFPLLLKWTDADVCKTPSGENGECIYLHNCAPLLSALLIVPLPVQVTDFIRESSCGQDKIGPKVCCGTLPPDLVTSSTEDSIDETDSYPDKKCGRDSGGDRIFGGNATALDDYPWLALLGYRNASGTYYKCGGSLINRRYVLTAAHCLIGRTVIKYGILSTVRLGEYDTQKSIDCVNDDCADPPQEIAVQGFYPHFGYSEDNINRADDIGLIRLAQKVNYNDFVKPICLASTEYSSETMVYVAGWGKTETAANSAVKLKVAIPIYEKSKCTKKFKFYGAQLTEKQLCAGGQFLRDSCYGDSGGPLMKLLPGDIWEAIGIVSFGYGCGNGGLPSVYTSVLSYRHWIQSKMIETNKK